MDEEQKKENALKVAKMIERLDGPYGSLRTIRELIRSVQPGMALYYTNNPLQSHNNFAVGFKIIEGQLSEVRKHYGVVLQDLESNRELYPEQKVIRAKNETVQKALKDVDAVSQSLAEVKETIRAFPIKLFS